MQKPAKYKIPPDYCIMLGICVLFATIALALDSPRAIFDGLVRIHTSRSVLITDYVALAGIGAALFNSAILLFLNLLMLILTKNAPNGKIIAALFLTMGFSLFGKNLFNTLPITAGVWLYGRLSGIKFSTLVLHGVVSTTIAPIVSEVAFFGDSATFYTIIAAYAVGVFVGFIFPVVAEYVKRMHSNFCLYNGGIAGGFIATMFAGLFQSFRRTRIESADYWSAEYTLHLTIIAGGIALALIAYSIIATDKPAISFRKFRKIMAESDPNDSDYFSKYGSSCYKNIGILCLLSIAVVLALGAASDSGPVLNGPILGGILTISGFAASGKHLRNTIPVLIGSIIAANFNYLGPTDPATILAILFSTGLAPIAGKYGWLWGMATGFLHVSIAVFIGDINGGLNLYNNGFAGSFVAVIILPVIEFSKGLYARIKARAKR